MKRKKFHSDVFPALPMDVVRSAEMIADDFADLEALFSQGMTLSHLTTTDRITMKEVEPLPRAQEFEAAEVQSYLSSYILSSSIPFFLLRFAMAIGFW